MKNDNANEKDSQKKEEKTSPFVLIIYGLALIILLPILGTISLFKGIASMDANEVGTHPIEIILVIVFFVALVGFIVLLIDSIKNKKK